MMQTIEQRRAKFALEQIKALQQQLDSKEQKEFISYAKALPAMIQMNGLGQSMAFCKVKGKRKEQNKIDSSRGVEAYRALYRIVSDWLSKTGQPYANHDVLDGITQMSMSQYQLAQVEAMMLMSWVKKFAKAFLAE